MGLLLAILPIALVTVVGGAIALWAIFDDERADDEAVVQRAEALQKLTEKPLVLFQPMAWSADLERMPLEELVSKLEVELVERRREAAAYATGARPTRPSPS